VLDQGEVTTASGLEEPRSSTIGSVQSSTLSEFDFGHLGPDHAAWQRAYAMPWRSWIGSFRMFDLVRDMEKP